MADQAPSRAQRDQNLDKLVQTVKKFGEVEKTRIENEEKFLRLVLRGRGATEAITKNLDVAAAHLQTDLDQLVSSSGA